MLSALKIFSLGSWVFLAFAGAPNGKGLVFPLRHCVPAIAQILGLTHCINFWSLLHRCMGASWIMWWLILVRIWRCRCRGQLPMLRQWASFGELCARNLWTWLKLLLPRLLCTLADVCCQHWQGRCWRHLSLGEFWAMLWTNAVWHFKMRLWVGLQGAGCF